MPFIRGIDDMGKVHWLQESGYWGEHVTAKNWTPAEAERLRKDIAIRNHSLKPSDRIVPEIVS